MQDLSPGVDTSSGRRLSNLTIDEGETISMVVSTAALPVFTKPTAIEKATPGEQCSALDAMWGTLSACMAPTIQDGNVHLPSQAQIIEGSSASSSDSQTAMDGLVLVFLASQQSDRVHCIDVTVRCNPPSNSNSTPVSPDEDVLDGWRGYWSPFEKEKSVTAGPTSSRNEDRVMLEHLSPSPSSGDECVVAMAACRQPGSKLWVACLAKTNLVVCEDPHLGLSCRIPVTINSSPDSVCYRLAVPWNEAQQGRGKCVDTTPGLVAVGTDIGGVQIYVVQKNFLRNILTIPSPGLNQQVTSLRFSVSPSKVSLFVCYHHRTAAPAAGGARSTGSKGICCYDLGSPSNTSTLSAPLARHDLDSRPVFSTRLCDTVPISTTGQPHFLVARADGLYSYSQTQKVGVSPIDGIKLTICNVPSHAKLTEKDAGGENTIGVTYALVASTDAKSGRDAIDVYDATNKLVAFHVLLSPAQKALQASGVSTPNTKAADGSMCGGRSSAIILTVRFQ